MLILSVKCNKTTHYSAFVVENKGANPHAVERSAEVFKYLGYREAIYRSDQEPAIGSLNEAVVMELKQSAEIKVQGTPVGDNAMKS